MMDIQSIHEYISQDSTILADKTIARLLQAISILETFPLIGRKGRILETKELVISNLPYIAVYTSIDDIDIDILTILHTSRKYP